MNSRSTHDRRRSDASARADRRPAGVWPSRDGDDDGVELIGADGAVTRVIQRPDGSIEIHTDAMSARGRAVRVPPNGSSRAVEG